MLRLSNVVFSPEFNTYKTTERWTRKFVFSVGRNVKGTEADLRKKKRNFKVFFLILLLKLFIFNWRLITLQYCGGFGHTLT